MVDLIPICEALCPFLRYRHKLTSLNILVRYTPTWFPGQQFAKHAAYARSLSGAARDRPYQRVKERLVSSLANGMYIQFRRLVQRCHPWSVD